MSWEENLATGLQITTGDGKVYKPLVKTEAHKASFDFNISEFHYPEVAGTHVDRRLRKGVRYPLEFYFHGADNIDEMKAFIQSSHDVRPWNVLHPIYGQFSGQPLAIEFDNSGINTAKINVTIVESLEYAGPKVVKAVKQSALKSATQAVEGGNEMAVQIQPSVSDVNTMKTTSTQMYAEASKGITTDEIGSAYFNAFSKAQNAINNALGDFSTGVTYINDFILYPSLFTTSVKNRFAILKAQALKLSFTLENLEKKYSKQLFEQQKGMVVVAAVQTVITPLEDDYTNAVDVLFMIEEMLGLYNGFIDELQVLQTEDTTQIESYAPDYQFMYDLNFAVNYAVSNLFNIALTAQQQRIVYLANDSNVIIEAHKYYGLTQDDSTIKRFVDTNNIQLNEVLQLKKGRKIIYYV